MLASPLSFCREIMSLLKQALLCSLFVGVNASAQTFSAADIKFYRTTKYHFEMEVRKASADVLMLQSTSVVKKEETQLLTYDDVPADNPYYKLIYNAEPIEWKDDSVSLSLELNSPNVDDELVEFAKNKLKFSESFSVFGGAKVALDRVMDAQGINDVATREKVLRRYLFVLKHYMFAESKTIEVIGDPFAKRSYRATSISDMEKLNTLPQLEFTNHSFYSNKKAGGVKANDVKHIYFSKSGEFARQFQEQLSRYEQIMIANYFLSVLRIWPTNVTLQPVDSERDNIPLSILDKNFRPDEYQLQCIHRSRKRYECEVTLRLVALVTMPKSEELPKYVMPKFVLDYLYNTGMSDSSIDIGEKTIDLSIFN